MSSAVKLPQRRFIIRFGFLLVCALYLFAGAVPLAVGVVRPGITGYQSCLLEDMVYGNADRPYVKRQLVPLLVRSGMTIVPESIKVELQEVFTDSSLVQFLRWPPAYALEFVLSLLVMYASMICFMVFLQRLLLTCLEVSGAIAHAVTLAVSVGLPLCFSGQLYLYDFMQLFLITSGLLYMMSGRWFAYYPVLAVACLNKETSVLLPVVFCCWKGRELFRRSNLLHFTAQMVIAVSICSVLAWIYRHNPGGNTEWHLLRNLAMQFSLLAWVRLTILALGTAFALWALRAAPRFLKRAFLAMLTILVTATFFFGYIDELRDYFDALPLGVVLVTAGFLRVFMRQPDIYRNEL